MLSKSAFYVDRYAYRADDIRLDGLVKFLYLCGALSQHDAFEVRNASCQNIVVLRLISTIWVMSFYKPTVARRSTAFVLRVLLRKTFSALRVACKQKGCVVIAVRNYVGSAIDHFLPQAPVKFGKF